MFWRRGRARVNILRLIAIILTLVACGVIAEAQQQAKVPRIGLLWPLQSARESTALEAFRLGLRELGYVEGKNVYIEYRYAEGKLDRLTDFAAQLVGLKVDVIVTRGNTAVKATKQATTTIPIVVGSAGDLVREGLVASLAKPGGNITGSTSIAPDLNGKRLELLRQVVPKAFRVAVLFHPNPGSWDEVRATQTAARDLGVKLQLVEFGDPNELQNIYAAMTKQQANAVMIVQTAFTNFRRKQLLELAAKNRLPSACEQSEWTQDGCLISYGPHLPHLWRRAAVFVDKILKGAKPADLPVEQPTKFELVINLKTAEKIGLAIPLELLKWADEVIK